MNLDEDGTKHWKLPNGLLHREDGPAVEKPDGDKWWYINGMSHREDGPAVECYDGTKEYWNYGDGPYDSLEAMIIGSIML